MIQANELRVGNLVHDNIGGVLKIKGISTESDLTHIRPIPLAEEWLLKFGFYKIVGWDDFTFYRKNGIDVDSNDDGYYFANRKIQYVHQLQNLYFALTGEELAIKN